jgi:hypothetical protein
MTGNIIFAAFVVAVISLLTLVAVLLHKDAKRCEAVGGHIISIYRDSLCVRDGLIVEDY